MDPGIDVGMMLTLAEIDPDRTFALASGWSWREANPGRMFALAESCPWQEGDLGRPGPGSRLALIGG